MTRKHALPQKAAVGRDREKRQPYAKESETYDNGAVKSPANSHLRDEGAEANARAEDIGKSHPDPEGSRRRER